MTFKALNDLISKDMPVDYWEDDRLFVAQEIVANLSENDWNVIVHSLPSKNNAWKRRLIQSISDAIGNQNAIQILLNCLEDADSEVVETAVDGLRNIIPDGGLALLDSQIEIIEQMISEGGLKAKVASEIKKTLFSSL